MSRLKLLAAGVALAVTASVSSTAEAGSKKVYRPCRPGVWYQQPSAPRYYAPPAPSASQSAVQPPAAAGSGVVRRYSYEPGTNAGPVPEIGAPTYRPITPNYRSSSAGSGRSSGGGFKAGLTGGDRLRPGSRNR